ncbi:hypothetical protein EDB84DRAFT_1441050 [Lactarius hengduanensis]|nr:hypothetical protein EDB84DRAFT_1441050 [Lactarius hengduanensis]
MATSRSLRKYNSQTTTPSPLRRKSFVPPDSDLDADSDLDTQPIDADDIFGRSSAFSAKPLRKHYTQDSPISKSSRIKGKSTTPPIPIEDDEGLFLSTASHSKLTPPRVSNPRTKRSMPPPPTPPVAFPTQSSSAFPRTATRTPSRSVPTAKSSASRKLPATSGTVGVKRKPNPLPVTAPYPKRGMTPLGVTKAVGEGSFGRLAPLSAPKFRNDRSSGETEGILRTESATLARLRIDKEEGAAVLGEEEEAVDVSPGGHITKRLARSRPVSQELMNSANAGSQSLLQTLAAAKPKHKHKPNTSSVTFPTTRPRTPSTTPSSPLTSPKPRQRTMHASNVSISSSHSKREEASSLVRTRKPSISQLRHPTERIESSGSATLFFGPALSRYPEASTPARSRPATMFALDSPAGASSTPAHLRSRPAFETLASTSRHSYAGPDTSLFGKARGFVQPTTPSSPVSEFLSLREAEMGEISDEDGSDFAPVEVDIRALDNEGAEDLFFSSSFIHSRDIGPDTSFGWDSTPTILSSSLTVNVTQSTPSPRSKIAPVACKLEKKYRPRDSGVVLSEDEGNNPGSHAVPDFVPPAPRQRYTLGRSESVNLTVPRASTSVSTLGSGSSDQELVTPVFGPSTSSCWPLLTSSSSAASSLGTPDVASVDASIMRILMQAARRDEHAPLGGNDVGGSIRPPGTPQKRVKTAMTFSGARPWQSAVASKIGFDFGNDEDEEDEDRGVKGPQGGGDKAVKRSKKAPRKSLPAAFPLLAMASRGRGRAAEDSEEEPGRPDGSPSERRAAYDGLGLGRPSVAKAAGASWLLRRSSSGAISSATSGSGSMSGDGSPTGAARAIHDWQLPPPRIPPRMSPLKSSIPSHLSLSSNRTASSSSEASSTATATMLASPTTRRLQSLSQSARGPGQHRRGSSEHDMRVSLGSSGGLGSTYAQPGRFEREFVEIGEAGSGEFGKVMKVRRQSNGTGTGQSGHISAVKKSKRFEGVRHRLRLREEVEILQHLFSTYSAVNGPGTRHPNVLGYIDNWEQDDALYIQTELCEFGNFAHFLWEYGRTFPQLDEARVWKIIADLSNGMHFIHDSGVIHLDLKPANIFITLEGRFKIGDFGMASLWPRPVLMSPAGGPEASLRTVRTAFEREGDKLYLAPEVLQGQYGKAADMFSFGITMLETASNIVVPGEGDPWHRLRHDDLSPADLPTDTSPELRALIAALLCANPAARIDSAAVCAHPVVVRTRAAMERLLEEALRAGERPFAASPLAGVPAGFLEEVLSHSREPTAVVTDADASDAMDVGA